MAQERIEKGIRVFSLAAADGIPCADIAPALGGTVSSLTLPGPDGRARECLHQCAWFWDPHTEQTRGGIPLLFPICGRLLKDGVPGLYHVRGQPFILPIHGFAMRRPWEVIEADVPDALRLRQTDSAQTRAMYPFAFELELHFRVSSEGFSCGLTVRNTGEDPMPFTAGFHSYFVTPPPGAGKEQTRFEAHPHARFLYNETKTDVIASAPPPAFPKSIADGDINGLLLEMSSCGDSRLLFPDGFALRQTASPLFRFRQFYTLPDEPFFCDEPWMAPPGSMNRPGAVHLLPPGHSESAMIHIAPASVPVPSGSLFSPRVALS